MKASNANVSSKLFIESESESESSWLDIENINVGENGLQYGVMKMKISAKMA
jgi:hypothetical protein